MKQFKNHIVTEREASSRNLVGCMACDLIYEAGQRVLRVSGTSDLICNTKACKSAYQPAGRQQDHAEMLTSYLEY